MSGGGASTRGPSIAIAFDASTDEIHRAVDELHRSREMIAQHDRLAAQGKLPKEESSCLTDEKVRRDRLQRTSRTKLAEAVVAGAGFFRGVRKDASSLGETLADIFAGLRNEVIPDLYQHFPMGNRPLHGGEADKFLTAANLNGLPPVFYDGENGLNLVVRQSGKAVANLNAETCREVLDYLRREHAYGNKVTGKAIDQHFQGLGYAWDREVLQIVLAVLLRGGAIELTYQGHKYRNHTDPACREPFSGTSAFRAASFAPRESLDLKMLADAARHYEAMTGDEVDIEEGALATAFQKLAADDRERVLPLAAEMRAAQLPGAAWLEQFKETIEGVLDMPTDDCVRKLAGEGKSYQESRERTRRLAATLTPENLQVLRAARGLLEVQMPVLAARGAAEDVSRAAGELADALASETFFDHFDLAAAHAETIGEAYRALYQGVHDERRDVYVAALDAVYGQPEWSLVAGNPAVTDDQRQALLSPLSRPGCDALEMPAGAAGCGHCRATVGQMEADLPAVAARQAQVLRDLQSLVVPEKRIIRVRVASVLAASWKTPKTSRKPWND